MTIVPAFMAHEAEIRWQVHARKHPPRRGPHCPSDYFGGCNSDEESHRSAISARRAFFNSASRSGPGGNFFARSRACSAWWIRRLFKRWISLISRFMRPPCRKAGARPVSQSPVIAKNTTVMSDPLTKSRRAHWLKRTCAEPRYHPTLTAKKESYTMSRRLCGASGGRHGCSS